jgi:hypothetical protein
LGRKRISATLYTDTIKKLIYNRDHESHWYDFSLIDESNGNDERAIDAHKEPQSIKSFEGFIEYLTNILTGIINKLVEHGLISK